MGGHVRHRAEPAAQWATRWRSHRLRRKSKMAPPDLAFNSFRAVALGSFVLAGMAGVGHDPDGAGPATSPDSSLSRTGPWTATAGAISAGDAGSYLYAGAATGVVGGLDTGIPEPAVSN